MHLQEWKHCYIIVVIIFLTAADTESNNEGMQKLQNNNKQQLGWIEMKVYKNYILNITPSLNQYVFNPQECSVLCMIQDFCISTNVIFNSKGNCSCQLLDSDIFRNSTYFQKHVSAAHYAVKV